MEMPVVETDGHEIGIIQLDTVKMGKSTCLQLTLDLAEFPKVFSKDPLSFGQLLLVASGRIVEVL